MPETLYQVIDDVGNIGVSATTDVNPLHLQIVVLLLSFENAQTILIIEKRDALNRNRNVKIRKGYSMDVKSDAKSIQNNRRVINYSTQI